MKSSEPQSSKNGALGQNAPESPGVHPRSVVAEESFRLLVDSVTDYGIFMLDPRGNIRTWNKGAERLKGYSFREVIGKNFSMFYLPEDLAREHPQHELEIAERVGKYEEEGWRVRKDGTRFWANVVITRLVGDDGETLGYSKVTRDLTERKAAEDALRASEEQARLVFESVKDYAIITLDPSGKVTSWNEGARRIKGYEASEIVGKHFSAFYPQEEVENGKCEYELREAAATGRFEDEGWRVRKDGTKFWANVVISALYDRDRRLRGFSKVTRDITERKRAEDRLKMANESLERRVQERTLALSAINATLQGEVLERKRAEEELRHAVRARDEFLSIASHELKTPLTPIRLQLQGMLNHLRKGTLTTLPPERIEKMVSTLERSLTRMGKLIDSLLDVARINAGKIEVHPESLDAGEVIQEICGRFQHEASIAGSTLSCLDVPAIPGQLDRIRLEQVVTNLVVNAIRYGRGNPIEVSARGAEGTLVLQVKDNGVGIAAEDLVRIFNRFEQVTQHTGAGGLGLGLYITRQIVEAQGGRIRVESRVGVGSTFTVEVPLGTRA